MLIQPSVNWSVVNVGNMVMSVIRQSFLAFQAEPVEIFDSIESIQVSGRANL